MNRTTRSVPARPAVRAAGLLLLALGGAAAPLQGQAAADPGEEARTTVRAEAERDSARRERGAGAVAVQAAAGALGSWALAIPTHRYLYEHAGDRDVKGDAGYSPTANAGLIVTSAVGNALGVYLAGEALGYQGSFWGALLGSGVASLPLFLGTEDPYLPYYALTVGVALQDLGSLIGY